MALTNEVIDKVTIEYIRNHPPKEPQLKPAEETKIRIPFTVSED